VTGPLFGEAVTVLFVTCRALAAWVVAAAFVVTVGLYTAILTGAWATRKARRAIRTGSAGPLAASEPECDPSVANTPTTPTAPSWARTGKEAA
jgi:hypothetical protein